MSHVPFVQRGRIPADTQVPGRWIRHDAKLTPPVVLGLVIVATFVAIGVIEGVADFLRWLTR